MVNKKNAFIFIFILLVFASCSQANKKEESANVNFSSLLDQLKKLSFSFSKSNHKYYSQVDSFVKFDSYLHYKNYRREKIILEDSILSNITGYIDLNQFNTMELGLWLDVFQGRGKQNNLMSNEIFDLICRKYLAKMYIYPDIKENMPEFEKWIQHWKVNYNPFWLSKWNYNQHFDSYLFYLLFEKETGSDVQLYMLNVKEHQIKSIVLMANYNALGVFERIPTYYEEIVRTNGKYFFSTWENLSEVIDVYIPDEERYNPPKNRLNYTQFYLDDDGYLQFIK